MQDSQSQNIYFNALEEKIKWHVNKMKLNSEVRKHFSAGLEVMPLQRKAVNQAQQIIPLKDFES